MASHSNRLASISRSPAAATRQLNSMRRTAARAHSLMSVLSMAFIVPFLPIFEMATDRNASCGVMR